MSSQNAGWKPALQVQTTCLFGVYVMYERLEQVYLIRTLTMPHDEIAAVAWGSLAMTIKVGQRSPSDSCSESNAYDEDEYERGKPALGNI